MSDLRDAAELALTALENTCPNNWTSVKENLRKALAQPKREWVGLTDEEIVKEISEEFNLILGHGNVSDECVIEYVRLIEAKLKEKNT
jgi:hypothetical protein